MKLLGYEIDETDLDKATTQILGHINDFSYYIRKLGTPEALEENGEELGDKFEKLFWVLSGIQRIKNC